MEPHNDYGLGFYCTESLDMAREWGCTAETDGVANRYEFDPTGLAVLDLSGDSFTVLHWLTVDMLRERWGSDAAGLR